MTPQDREILVESMRSERNPNPNPPEHAVRLLEETCQRTGLDWKLRHVYLIQRGGKWQVTVSIDGFRLVANQDPQYAGQEGPFWTMAPDGAWTDIPPDKAPYAAKVGVVRRDGGTTWGVAKYVDYNAKSPMWTKFASTMIAKCAEMLALRKALPGKLGGLYGVEEMDQADRGEKAPDRAKNTPNVNKAPDLYERLRRAESARNTTPTKDSFDSPDGATNSWEARIASCKTSEELKTLGAEISKSGMSGDEKLWLSKTYTAKKVELASASV